MGDGGATSPGEGGGPSRDRRREALGRLVRPRSVAVVGASDDPGSIGGAPVALLERFGYPGEVHLVSRTRREIGGRPCVASIEDLPDGVDAAILAIPRSGVSEAVEQAGRRGVGGVVVFSSGYAELDEDGASEQHALASAAERHGIAVAGPNCLGLVNFVDGVPLTFGDVSPNRRVDRPGIAVVAQSGAMSLALTYAAMAEGTTVRYAISTGNEAVIGIEDHVGLVLDDELTRAVVLLVEQVRRPAELLDLARRARERAVLLLVLQTGRGERAKAASLTHTGAVAGDQEVLRAVLGREGVCVVDSLDGLVDAACLAARQGLPRSEGVAFMTDSGAAKTFALDVAESEGVVLPELSPASRDALARELPSFATATNPVDITAMGLNDPSLYARVASVLLADDAVGTLVVSAMPGSEVQGTGQVDALLPVLAGARKPVVYTIMGGDWPIPERNALRILDASVPLLRSPERALRAVRDVSRAAASARDAASRRRPLEVAPAYRRGASGRRVLGEHEAKGLLAGAGIATPGGELVSDPESAARVAREIGGPVVVKVSSPDVAHKSDVGGVAFARDPEEAADAYRSVCASVAAALPGARLDGVLVEESVTGGVEMLLGARRDETWGPYLVLGLGGVFTETFRDAVVLPADAGRDEVLAAVAGLRSAPLLAGARGTGAHDVASLAAAAELLGALLRRSPEIEEIEVNPLLVRGEGLGVVALDALVTTSAGAASR
ncbi:MAG: acetate--CoA ligase family protein [Actinomycetota bacterium]|nr:acetate--CoA ligase family protein [Actinomycetota bacterium]